MSKDLIEKATISSTLLEVKFNGIKLNDYVRIMDVSRPVMPPVMNNIQQNATVDGAVLLNSKYDHVYITVSFAFVNDVTRGRQILSAIVNMDGDKRLEFSDEPDRYRMARIDGSTGVKEDATVGKGTLTFLCPDPMLYSKTPSTVTKTVSNKEVVTINNDGTYRTFPIVKIKHKSDNGYLGIVHNGKIFEMGNPNESDTTNYKQSETLFDYTNQVSSMIQNTNQAVTNTPTTYNGTLTTLDWEGNQYVQLNGQTSSTSILIPNDSENQGPGLNDYLWWRQVFWAGAVNQYGYIKISVTDSNNRFLYGAETIKRRNGLESEYNIVTTDGSTSYKVVKSFQFVASDKEYDNPFIPTKGYSDIRRNDGTLDMFWFGSRYVIHVPELIGKKASKVHVIMSNMGNDVISRMYVRGIKYIKDYVNKTKDIPNKYSSGSEVEVNNSTNNIKVDGLDQVDDYVIGSEFIELLPGENKLQFFTSTWNKNPIDVEIQYVRRWLS